MDPTSLLATRTRVVVAAATAAVGTVLTVWVTTKRNKKKRFVSGRDAQVCVVVGSQWGDEGKGKLVDVLAAEVDVVARFNGGANAGHTLEVDGKKYAFHLLPCGMLHARCDNVIGNGVVAHLPTLFEELEQLGKDDDVTESLKRLVISSRAHVLLDSHRHIDGALEVEKTSSTLGAIGTTKRGIGPCYASKANRNGLRMCDLLDGDETLREKLTALRAFQARHYPGASPSPPVADDDAEFLQLREYRDKFVAAGCVRDTVTYLSDALDVKGKKVLCEGANAAMLDLDFGTYPYVTSSSTVAGGVCTGLGLPPKRIDCVVGVVKAYTTRVGAGPFPTELELDHGPGEHLSTVGREYGTTTGRKRRCGWLDAPLLRYSHALNGYDSVCLTKLDVLTGLAKIKLAVRYVSPKHDVKEEHPPKSKRHKQHPRQGDAPRDVYMPASLLDLADVRVEYVEMDGWDDDITTCKSFYDLPAQAQHYVRAIEQYTGLVVSWVGVGAGRSEIFKMPGIQ